MREKMMLKAWIKDYLKQGGIADQGGSPEDYFNPISYENNILPESVKQFEDIKSIILERREQEILNKGE